MICSAEFREARTLRFGRDSNEGWCSFRSRKSSSTKAIFCSSGVSANPIEGAVPSQRHVGLDTAHDRYRGLGSLGLLLVAGARRRARRLPR